MKLHVTLTSPYARLARIAIIEHGLDGRVDVIEARTRQTGSPYYATNPSGRVPYLELGNGRGFEESNLICAYFDHIGSGPPLVWAPEHADWEYGRLDALARSFVDGISVWSRELRRPETERSPAIIAHETARAERLIDVWSKEVRHPIMQGAPNLAQLTLLAAIDSARVSLNRDFTAPSEAIAVWYQRLAQRPSIVETRAPCPA